MCESRQWLPEAKSVPLAGGAQNLRKQSISGRRRSRTFIGPAACLVDADPAARVVVCGDLNSREHDAPMRILRGARDEDTPQTMPRILVPLAERMPLPAGAAYISDLIGCTVYDRDQPLGVVSSVQFPTSPDGLRRLEEAAPLLAVKLPEGEEVLVPFASALLLGVDLAAKSIRMTLPEGLAEINRASEERGEEKG